MPIRGVIGRAAWASVALGTVVAMVGAIDGGPAALLSARVKKANAANAPAVAAFVEAVAHPRGKGVYLLDRAGGVHTEGDAIYRGSLPGRGIAAEAAELVPTANGRGYWIVSTDGGVHAFDAPYFGSPAETRGAGAPVIAAAATPSGQGYVVLDAQGGIFTFGDAPYLGSVPGLRNAGHQIGPAPAVDVAVARSGNGYYVLDAEGGIFTFGDAPYLGSVPGLRASGVPIGRADVRDLVVASDGGGYWATDSAGGLFTFGAVQFHGSAPGVGRAWSLVATAVLPDGSGYWMMDGTGALLAFGGASAQAASAPGAYKAIETQADGSPVRFNPCRSIAYVVHVGPGAPGNAAALAAEAFARVSDATGISFVNRGTTDEVFSARLDRPKWNHPAYGPGPTPLLVSFESPTSTNGLRSEDAGVAGRLFSTNDRGQRVVVTAALAVNTQSGLPADFSNAGSYGAVLLHEIGHTMGLDHVEDTRQIMSSVLVRGNPGEYQDGDRRGLAAIGTSGGCLQDPTPR